MKGNKELLAFEIAGYFAFDGEVKEVSPYGNGHINDTYRVTCQDGGKTFWYILQKMNGSVFAHPDEVMENVCSVTSFLQEKIRSEGGDVQRETMHFVLTKEGKICYQTSDGQYWRASHLVENTVTLESANEETFYESARAFGHFQYLLNSYPSEKLHETIPDFHNTVKRYRDFMESVERDACQRISETETEIRFLKEREALSHRLLDPLERGELPLRVTHNDTKLNNILFDKETGKAICVIDLDTVMPGLAAYDFGDSIRFGAATAAEDEPDLDKVHFDFKLYEVYTKGFLKGCKGILTEKEREMLPYGALVITFEQALRFLKDYLDGDIYYKTERPDQNLDRTRTQIRLLMEMEQNFDKMREVTQHGI
jgi:hypothetical protein